VNLTELADDGVTWRVFISEVLNSLVSLPRSESLPFLMLPILIIINTSSVRFEAGVATNTLQCLT
jgi:hypothetical protein